LAAYRLSAHATAEPSKGPIGCLLRQILTRRVVGRNGQIDRGALALLFAADRLDHTRDEVVPLLAEGRWVISDRYVLSSLAYQSLDLPQAYVAQINARAPRPDLTIFLDVPPEVSLRRRHAEAASPDLFENLATQRKVARGYQRALAQGLELAALGPVVVLDGTGSIGGVADAIERTVTRRFKLERPASGRLQA
jgi:dTMP kinase